MLSALAFIFLSTLQCTTLGTYVSRDTQQPMQLDNVKVPVILGVMSACPDALICESVFDRVLKKVADKTDLALTYIAHANASEPDFGVTCKHGPRECAGNVQQLCVAKYHAQPRWWQFVQCQNYQGKAKIGDPAVALRCARAAGIDWAGSGAGACAGMDGSGTAQEGVELLKESAESTAGLKIEKSCTVMISGRQVCLRDGQWKQCENGHQPEDFIRQINAEYRRLNSEQV